VKFRMETDHYHSYISLQNIVCKERITNRAKMINFKVISHKINYVIT
jgi:hypothetical protein